jgi:hypothetical protein
LTEANLTCIYAGFTPDALECVTTELAHHFQFDEGSLDRAQERDAPSFPQNQITSTGVVRFRHSSKEDVSSDGQQIAVP